MKLVAPFKEGVCQLIRTYYTKLWTHPPIPSASPVCPQSEINPTEPFLNLSLFSDKVLGADGHIFHCATTEGSRKYLTEWHPSHEEGKNCLTESCAGGKSVKSKAQTELQETLCTSEVNFSQSHTVTIFVRVRVRVTAPFCAGG